MHDRVSNFLWFLVCILYRRKQGVMHQSPDYTCTWCHMVGKPTAVYFYRYQGAHTVRPLCTACATRLHARPPYPTVKEAVL